MRDRTILGLTGQVILKSNDGEDKQFVARIDSGATSSSIDISLAKLLNFKPTKKHRIVKSASGIKRRPIVNANVKIKGKEMLAEFTLADRGHMTYQILIGQNILKEGKFMIDPLLEEK
tara:strand:- start:382 stop:735 length:354 start_codon:yes stop_codon:yes gene_type:complete